MLALYDRDYMNNNQSNDMYSSSSAHSVSDVQEYVKHTYKLFAASLLAGTVGAYVGVGMAPVIASFKWAILILEIALLIGLHFVKHKPGINLMVLFTFTFVSGLSIGPLLSATLGLAGGANIVAGSFMTTTMIFGGLSLVAIYSGIDFTRMGKVLFVALILLVIASVINMFIMNSMMQVIIASFSAVLFSAFILYDTQNIINGDYETPIDGAIALYLDFFNLFVSLLQIFGIFSKDE
jgi:modulator of FtsH protease